MAEKDEATKHLNGDDTIKPYVHFFYAHIKFFLF